MLNVSEACVQALKRMGRLPADHPRTDPSRLPLRLPHPPDSLTGRVQQREEMLQQLREKRCIQVWGGPGEGKTTLVRAIGRQLFWRGVFPHGAFELDMTGGCGTLVLSPAVS